MKWEKSLISGLIIFILSSLCHSESMLGAWTIINNTNIARASIKAVLVDTTIYLLGGFSFSSTPVEKSHILLSNDLSSWTIESSQMVDEREGLVAISANGYIYAIGGTNSFASPSTVERAKINPDSSLGEWTTISNLPFSMYACSAVTTNGYLYIIGGYSERSSIYRSSLYSDGSLGSWILSTSHLNIGRDGASSIIVNGYLYTACGIGGTTGLTKIIERAQIYPDGELSSFFIISSTQAFHASAPLSKIGNYLYMIDGYQGGDYNYRVERAYINPDMSLGAWEPASYLVQQRGGGFGYVQNTSALFVIDGVTFGGTFLKSVERALIISDTGIELEKWQGLE